MPDYFFTAVELCTYDDDITKPWFVYFDITDRQTGITLRKQFRGGINFYKNIKERLKHGEELRKFWEERLKYGWTPFEHSSASSLSKMKFNEALDWALSKCKVAKKTKSGYTGAVEFFKVAAKKLHLDKAYITGIRRQHIRLMLDQITEDRKWSNHAYNKNANYISGVFSRLIEYEIIENNPAHHITPLPVAESDKYEDITSREKILIRDHLLKVHPSYFTYLMLIYHTGIRPKECLLLKIPDIHFEQRYIKIVPDIEEENSKTKTVRIVPLNDHILQLLKVHIYGYENMNYFVFGSPNAPVGQRRTDKQNKSGSIRTDYFLPSQFSMKRDTATKTWKRLVWDGLGIHKYQYAMKHTGGNDKILAGVPLDALREMYGHSSKRMTQKYARKILGVYREQIINGSPDFI